MMKIGIIGSGNIGSTEGKLWLKAGHQVMYGSRHPALLPDKDLGKGAQYGTIREAAGFGEIVLLSVPWSALDEVIAQLGDAVAHKVVIDATNQYGPGGQIRLPGGQTATAYNTSRIRCQGLVKAYNTLTAGFQWQAGNRTGEDRVVMPYAGDDETAKQVVAQLIRDSGFVPYDVGDAAFIEPPRGEDSLYGEEWHLDTIVEKLKQLSTR